MHLAFIQTRFQSGADPQHHYRCVIEWACFFNVTGGILSTNSSPGGTARFIVDVQITLDLQRVEQALEHYFSRELVTLS